MFSKKKSKTPFTALTDEMAKRLVQYKEEEKKLRRELIDKCDSMSDEDLSEKYWEIMMVRAKYDEIRSLFEVHM